MSEPDPAPASADLAAIDRSISPVADGFRGPRAGKALVLAGLVAGCGLFLAATWRGGPAKPPARPLPATRQVVAFEPAAPPTLDHPGPGAPSLTDRPKTDAVAAGPATAPGHGPSVDPKAQARAATAAERAAPLMAFAHSEGATDAPSLASVPRAADTAESVPPKTELEQLRQGSAIGLARAGRLPDRNFLIVAGTQIPCLLQTAMDTATPGYVSCLIPRDVLSDNGAVVLLEKGARVLGEYRASLRQGQQRLFVLWTRAVTPAGVAIALASPAADALGRAGFDGRLDTHFWDRFGGALLLSVVDDTAAGLARGDTAPGVVRAPSDAAAVALQNSVNIAPSLKKAQGAEVSIFVAQDLDFSGVYGLATP